MSTNTIVTTTQKAAVRSSTIPSSAAPSRAPSPSTDPAPTRSPPGEDLSARALARIRRALSRDDGAATAEYALVIMAGVALAGVLLLVVQSDAVHQIIESLVLEAFTR